MADIASAPIANQESAQARLKQRDDLIRAGGIKEGRKLQAAEDAVDAARIAAQHKGQLAGMTEAHANELARQRAQHDREEAKHGAWRFWKGFAIGGVLFATLAGAGSLYVVEMSQRNAFDAALQAAAQSTTTGYMLRQVDDGK